VLDLEVAIVNFLVFGLSWTQILPNSGDYVNHHTTDVLHLFLNHATRYIFFLSKSIFILLYIVLKVVLNTITLTLPPLTIQPTFVALAQILVYTEVLSLLNDCVSISATKRTSSASHWNVTYSCHYIAEKFLTWC
jgi:hypothetical protein